MNNKRRFLSSVPSVSPASRRKIGSKENSDKSPIYKIWLDDDLEDPKWALLILGLLFAIVFVSKCPAWAQDDDQDKTEKLAAWAVISDVLRHPRCLNCHQKVTPLQGDSRRVHIPAVVGGKDGLGSGPMQCGNCHNQIGNNEMAGVPGAPGWRLAPESMAWQGLSTGKLCRTLLDPAANRGRSPDQLLEHMQSESLVLWGWAPGEGRQPVPIDHQNFIGLLKIWAKDGPICPD